MSRILGNVGGAICMSNGNKEESHSSFESESGIFNVWRHSLSKASVDMGIDTINAAKRWQTRETEHQSRTGSKRLKISMHRTSSGILSKGEHASEQSNKGRSSSSKPSKNRLGMYSLFSNPLIADATPIEATRLYRCVQCFRAYQRHE
mmetsp:Transcript_38346/g.62120  ORF Transcript_38346/g.62120 Transcript_38346/m.62120 type:complete len:148 (-) Transcript_38346:68-511(-)